MDELLEADGSVVSSSQHLIDAWQKDRSMPVLLGIILNVYPADHKDNTTAQQSSDLRGIRHECTVLATDYLGKQPDILIPGVIIPPRSHSGIDNYEEDLPRGCSSMVDGSTFDSSFKNIDYSKLDGEWCLVSFVGGAIEAPFISNWWSHPYNKFDLATCGYGYDGEALVQQSQSKNRSRYMRRVNGTYFLVNKYGSVYLDTTESNSSVSVSSGKLKRELVAKGGHIQVDVESSAQLEINFNAKDHKGARLGAGSTKNAPVTDEDLPHPDQPITSSTPTARETTRTYIRGKEYKLFLKTSGLSVFCEDTSSEDGGQDGTFDARAHDAISLAVQPDGGTATILNIDKDTVTAVTADGSTISLGNDQALMLTAGGGQISIISGQISITGPTGVTVSVPATFGPAAVDGIMLGTSFVASQTTLFTAWTTFQTALNTYIEKIKDKVDSSPKYPITKDLQDAIKAFETAKQAHTALATKYVSAQVLSQ
jgi:hypothetical protein